MADTPITAATRSDLDILADVENAITQYPPAVNDRHQVKVQVEGGVVTLTGHLKTTITLGYLKETLPQIEGVKQVGMSELYIDERLRLEVGRHTPIGVWANVEYGHVMLTGRLPDGMPANTLIAQIRGIPGVRDVRTQFIA